VGVVPYLGPLYESLEKVAGPQGAIISRFGVGYDSIDLECARKHSVIVTNTPGVLDISVAEHTVWLIGSLVRHVAKLDAAMKTGDFLPRTGMELRGKTLGILGFGGIGRRVAAIAHFGFGMRVIAAGRADGEELSRREGTAIGDIQRQYGVGQYTNDMELVLRQADVLSIHLPAVATTENFVDADRLAMMKRDALLINTARGAVLDEDALYDALSSSRLAGAALDVFECEPYQPTSPHKDLRLLDSVVLTPHVGSNTREANARMAKASLENVANFFAGRMAELSRV